MVYLTLKVEGQHLRKMFRKIKTVSLQAKKLITYVTFIFYKFSQSFE